MSESYELIKIIKLIIMKVVNNITTSQIIIIVNKSIKKLLTFVHGLLEYIDEFKNNV